MFGFLKATPVYLKIFENKMELVNLRSSETFTGVPLQNFSTQRLLLANFNHAEELARRLVREARLQNKRIKVLVHPMHIAEEGISEIEKRALRDLAEQMGASSVLIVTEQKQLSLEEVKEIFAVS